MTVLITAASKHGSTWRIAEFMAERLRDAGLPVELLRPEQVTDVTPFTTVVLGSAIYGGAWLRAAVDLTERLTEDLVMRDLWLFSSGPVGEPLTPATSAAPKATRNLPARSHATFAGRLDDAVLNRRERLMTKVVRARSGDYRDWPRVAEWTDRIGASEALLAAGTRRAP